MVYCRQLLCHITTGKGKVVFVMIQVSHESKAFDFYMCYCGEEICEPSHAYGPSIRDHHIIHYVLRGKGSLSMNGLSYPVCPRQGFFIPKNEVALYQADAHEPWHYIWLAFSGERSDHYLRQAGLSASSPVFTYQGDELQKCLYRLIPFYGADGQEVECNVLSGLYHFFALLIGNNPQRQAAGQNTQQLYVQKAAEFMYYNLHMKLKIPEIAAHVGIDPSYLCSLFRKYMGLSPGQYLLHLRIRTATRLLENPGLSIGDISRSVGYADQFTFSKIYKKMTGHSPLQKRKMLLSGKPGSSKERL